MLAFSKDTSVKPSEVYVLQFADKPAALSFANSNSKFTNTQGRTVLAIDNSPSIDPVAATAKPYTLLILGWDPTRRLNLDTSGTRVIAECSNCQQTSSLVVGTNAAGVANSSLSISTAGKPAETYVLGFASREEALAFVQALPASAEIHRKTVLLMLPPATP